MNGFAARCSALVFSSLLVLTIPALAGEHPAAEHPGAPSPEEMAKMMEKWTKVASPSEHHKHLDTFVGTWDTVQRVWMGGPDASATETKGTSEVKWVLDGRFIVEEYRGEMMGRPYSGMGLFGYDNFRNLYVGTWASNQGTNLFTMSGQRDPSGKTWTYYGELDEPMLDVVGRMVKCETTVVGPDAHTFAIYDLHAGGDYKVFEIAYTRVK